MHRYEGQPPDSVGPCSATTGTRAAYDGGVLADGSAGAGAGSEVKAKQRPSRRPGDSGGSLNERAIIGCLIGTAVGDSLGLPAEGLSRQRVAQRWPGPWRHRLLGRWGMCSDDTEHAFFVAQSLLACGGDVERFRRGLAWRLRWWLLALPAGVGMATARACVRLWLGWSAHRAGVWSAGNGPSMRAPVLGVVFAGDTERRARFLAASTQLTHRDPLALLAAQAIADLTAAAADPAFEGASWLHSLCQQAPAEHPAWRDALVELQAAVAEASTLDDVARSLQLERGISGYSLHTVPMVIAATLLHRDEPELGLTALWRCGGDTDTTGAIAGAVFGARHGPDCWPEEWVGGIHNGPLSPALLRRAGAALAAPAPTKPLAWWWPLVPPRNLVFLLIVLLHGLRRLWPR